MEDGITPLPKNRGDAIPDANIPPVLAGMDKAEESGQFAVVVGCVAQLNKMTALGADQKGFRGHSTHYNRR
ncbi:hypothetical protein SynWH8103_00381 [Synechococcus sp. WH 8103]|nr:hypothetical protein SynWH8103_00381 [Synechococcus sp. WH 8103]